MLRTQSTRGFTLAFALALAVCSTVAVAGAQSAAISLADTSIQAQVWPEIDPDNTLVIVGATLPTDTPLPVVVELPLPAGAQVQWAGEIEGTDPDLDVERTPEVVPATGGSAVRFTVEQYPSFQYEAFIPRAALDPADVNITFDWIQTVPSLDISIAWKLPAGISDVSFDPDAPGQPAMNEVGESLYTLAPLTLQPGDSMSFSASYVHADAQSDSGSGIGVMPILIGALIIALVALVIVAMRQRQNVDYEE